MTVVTQSVSTTVLSIFHLIDWCVKFAFFHVMKRSLQNIAGTAIASPAGVEKEKTVADREYSFPMCREANFKTIAHHEANRAIKELLIYCPNNKEGLPGKAFMNWSTGRS